MTIQLRDYQREAIAAIYSWFPDTPWRWLYTAITRSAKVVVVAQ